MSAIDYDDDLLQYSLGVAAPRPALGYYDAVRMYFQGGEWNAAEMAEALRDHGFPLADATSVLEFACGWGRVTRHLVHLLDRSRLTVSDVDAAAVRFVCNKLDVRGFSSAIDPRDVRHRARYDVILIVSLFSHLPLADWGPWLGRLGELLEPGGALVFSTHGMHAFGVDVSDAEREAFEEVAEGFFYRTVNETRGRLSTDHYGLTYVAESRVRDLVGRKLPGLHRRRLPAQAQRLPGRLRPPAQHRVNLLRAAAQARSVAVQLSDGALERCSRQRDLAGEAPLG